MEQRSLRDFFGKGKRRASPESTASSSAAVIDLTADDDNHGNKKLKSDREFQEVEEKSSQGRNGETTKQETDICISDETAPTSTAKTSSDNFSQITEKASSPEKQRWDTALREFDIHQQAKFFAVAKPVADENSPRTGCPYALLANLFEAVESTTKRIPIIRMLTNAFRVMLEYTPGDIESAMYLATNQIADSFEGDELTIGSSVVVSSLCDVLGMKRDKIREQYKELGDLGSIAGKYYKHQQKLVQSRDLSISSVHNSLQRLAEVSGTGSANAKKQQITKLLHHANTASQLKYMVRILVGNLRIGVNRLTALQGLGSAALVHEKYSSQLRYVSETTLKPKFDKIYQEVKYAYSVCSSLKAVIEKILNFGIEKLPDVCSVTPGIPIQPMLAKACSEPAEVVNHFVSLSSKEKSSGPFIIEYKYDGQRAQIHTLSGEENTKVYSRHLEDSTKRWPDVVKLVGEFKNRQIGGCADKSVNSFLVQHFGKYVESFILDVEIVAVDDADKPKILPFQTLSSRNKKEATMDDLTVSVCVCAFDILHLNGKELLHVPLWLRRFLLLTCFPQKDGKFVVTDATVVDPNSSDAVETLNHWMEAAGNDSCEGLMCKSLGYCGKDMKKLSSLAYGMFPAASKLIGSDPYDTSGFVSEDIAKMETCHLNTGDYSSYFPSERSDTWLKLKRDYVNELADSLELVPIGAWYGNGRKAGWYSPVLLACYDEEFQKWQSVCRCMSGFTDEFYKVSVDRVQNACLLIIRVSVTFLQNMKQYYSDENLLSVPKETVPSCYETRERPPVWFRPSEVWEIRVAEFTLSRVHRAASHLLEEENDQADGEKGIACRFPRLFRNRPDRTPQDATKGMLSI